MKEMKVLAAMAAALAAQTLTAGVTLNGDEITNVTIKVDFDRIVGTVKPEHGVGQPPMNGLPNKGVMIPMLKNAGVPFARLHDVGGRFGGGVYVDIPNLFRDFDADETKEESYDFAFTDRLMEELEKNGVEPYYRLGVTIENHPYVKRYRIDPPKDFAKWARICEHVIRHYTEGWANGYRMKVTYWEIWNEPDSKPDQEKSMMWHAPFSEYCRLYGVVSKHLKAKFPHLKIGGYAACGFYHITGRRLWGADDGARFPYYVKCFEDFVGYVKDNGCPLDFFSYHCYDAVSNAVRHAEYVRRTLDKAGLTGTEMSLNEWLTDAPTPSVAQAAEIAAMMIACQNGPVDNAMVYDARCGVGRYSPLFDPATCAPRPAYWTLKAFNELYVRKNAVRCEPQVLRDGGRIACDLRDVYMAAAEKDGDGAILIANISDREALPLPMSFDLGDREIVGCRLIDRIYAYQETLVTESLDPNSVILLFTRRKK